MSTDDVSTGEKPAKPKRYNFKAEIQQLLDLLIHSVYASKDIFLRELISNAADALEKVRFAEVQGETVHDPGRALEIELETREEGDQKILVVRDSGIGMTAEELRTNIGTIAHSGATAFMERLKEEGKSPDLSLIGRFGVGFYAVFMAADKVVVTSRSAQPDASTATWTSTGAGSFTIETSDEERPRGTEIAIHLKADEDRFADPHTLRATIHKYSNFIPFPVKVEGETANQTTALWREPESQVSEEQYNEFFRFVSFAAGDPRMRLHFSADSPLQFSALLFVPESNPEALGFGDDEVRLQLYVRRVLIDSENKDLLPNYLRFVKGVVESEDLPLNISRETLQENRYVVKMREILTKKLLGMFEKLASEKPDEYREFWRAFGRFLKEGYSDFANRDRIHGLLRFNSSTHSDQEGLTSLGEYVERMGEDRDTIYYLTGASRDALAQDPRLELFRKNDIEVLYLYEPADEFVLSGVGEFEGKKLASADQAKPEELGGGSATTPEEGDEPASDIGALIDRVKALLGDRVTDVRASERLVDSPACLVSDDGMSSHMDRMMRMMNKDAEIPKRTLELNPSHPLIRDLRALVEKDADDPFVGLATEQMFEGALLADGYLADPHRLVARMNEVLTEAARSKAGDSSS